MSALQFSFPNPVNEVAARITAGGVVLLALLAIVADLPWVSVVLAIGFALRVGWGPRFSPLALLSTKVIAPRVGAPKLVAGPPKRFAQTIGLVFSTVAALLFYAFDAVTAGDVVLGLLAGAATLESVFGICLGCNAFAVLIRLGVIPEEVCEACNDIWANRERPAVSN